MYVSGLTGAKQSIRQVLFLILMTLCMSATYAAGIDVGKTETRLAEDVYLLNADIYYTLSDEVLEALENGVIITMQVAIRVERVREYLWNERIDEQILRYQLQYHALSGQYLVESLDSTESQSYLSLASALRVIGTIRDLPLLEQTKVREGEHYQVQLRSELDTNSLPAPLRPLAWLSSGWLLHSEWVTCPLRS